MAFKTKNVLIISLLSIALLLLLWWLIFLSTQELPSQKKKLQDAMINFQTILYKLSNAKEYDNTLKFIKDSTTLINSLFISQKNALNLVKTFEKDAQKIGLQLKFNPNDTKESETSLKLSFDLTGSFINIYQFLNTLETYPYFININNININRAEIQTNTKTNKKGPAITTATIIIEVLTQK
jgi:Tfp pilus assembly protein PilO